MLHAVGCNAQHGLRRTREDKRRAVRMLLEDAEWSQWSDREISRVTNTTHPFVAKLRAELNSAPRLETFPDAPTTPETRKFERAGAVHEQRVQKAVPATPAAPADPRPASPAQTEADDDHADTVQLLEDMQQDLQRAELSPVTGIVSSEAAQDAAAGDDVQAVTGELPSEDGDHLVNSPDAPAEAVPHLSTLTDAPAEPTTYQVDGKDFALAVGQNG